MIWILLIALVYIDSMAIYFAHKSGMYEPIQLFFQILLILILPFVGALFVLNMALSQLKSLPQCGKPVQVKSRLLELLFLASVLTSNGHSGKSESNASIDSVSTGGDNSD